MSSTYMSDIFQVEPDLHTAIVVVKRQTDVAVQTEEDGEHVEELAGKLTVCSRLCGLHATSCADLFTAALKAMLEQESASRRRTQTAYEEAQLRRVQAESALANVRQEQASPFVVPAMMDAFAKLVQLSDAVLLASAESA